jgi:hypothetical protein
MSDVMSNAVVVPSAVLMRELDGEAVLLNLDSERYFGLDEVGTRMWNVMTTSPTLGAARDVLAGEYDVPAETLSADMTRLVEELVENGLLAYAEP